MKSEPLIPEKRWKDLASRIDALIVSFQLAPEESVNGKKRQMLIDLRDYMKELEGNVTIDGSTVVDIAIKENACAGCTTTEGDCPSCSAKPAVAKPVSNACDGCPPGPYCDTQCWCKKCPERLKCPGQDDCLYDDNHKQIREVR